MAEELDDKIKIGVSSCLLGEQVRYNGGHKCDSFLVQELSRYFDYRPFCPELAAGLGIPRPAIRLIQSDHGDRAVNSDNYQIDHTDKLAGLARQHLENFENLSGYIFMQKSPSCGAFRVKRYNPDNNIPDGHGPGIFAAQVQQLLPWLPVEEAGRLRDSRLGENFLIRVFALAQWQRQVLGQPSLANLMRFQAQHKYLLMAHNPMLAKTMGEELAALSKEEVVAFLPRYRQLLMQALAKPATRGQKVNALEHIKGYLKRHLSAAEKQSLLKIIQDYQNGKVPFVVPLTMVKHLLDIHLADNDYLQQQRFLEPVPQELGFANRT